MSPAVLCHVSRKIGRPHRFLSRTATHPRTLGMTSMARHSIPGVHYCVGGGRSSNHFGYGLSGFAFGSRPGQLSHPSLYRITPNPAGLTPISMSHTPEEVKKTAEHGKTSEKTPRSQRTRKIPVRPKSVCHTRRKVGDAPSPSALARLVDALAAEDLRFQFAGMTVARRINHRGCILFYFPTAEDRARPAHGFCSC